MNDDYLWDKSGEPDPEVQQLEQILGTLRYQPRPLEIPDDLVVQRRRNYFPLLAIAATVVIALLAAGLWWQATSHKTPKMQQAGVEQQMPPASVNHESDPGTLARNNTAAKAENVVHRHRHQSANLLANNGKRRTNSTATALNTAQEKEAQDAKVQLMMALRVASEKLNVVQRKTQGGAAPNQIRNQHKIG